MILIYGSRLAPYTYVRIIFFHPSDEVLVTIRLVRPHSVLDIPVKHTERRTLHLTHVVHLYGVHKETVV